MRRRGISPKPIWRIDVNRKRILAAMIIIIGSLWSPISAAERKVLTLTLDEAIARALKNNLDIAVQAFNPELAAGQLIKAREAFLPQFALTFGSDHSENPSYWWLQGEGTSIDKLNNYSASVSETIPTGGSLSLSLQNYRSETNQSFQLINPRFGTTLSFRFTQPLLRNFGLKIARRQVIAARTNLEIADVELQGTVMETIYLVQEAYWNLVYAVDSLQVKRQSLELGRDLLAKNRKEVEFGQMAPIEILNAEATVAQREADLIQAEALVTRSQEVLKSILNFGTEDGGRDLRLDPSDRPAYQSVSLNPDEALESALGNRPDLQALAKNLDNKTLNLEVARNQMLPSLDFEFSYGSPGISGDRLMYLNDDPFLGVIIGKVPGSAGDSFRDAFKFLYNNWTIGLSLSFPLASALSRADVAYARTDLAQSQTRLKNLRKKAELEVGDALREVESNAKRIEAYRLARELAEKSLEAEQKKQAVGMSTNYFVLDFQDRLANARLLELRSKIDYILSVERLEKATGTSLVKRGLKS
ncbi:MAG: TolC family protein [Candidatus Aminicenantes bacterium]|nr:TolC family protein [Candidatus Aminicenantes bacterium]